MAEPPPPQPPGVAAEPQPPPPPPPQGASARPESLRPELKKVAMVQPRHPEKERFIAATSLVFILLAGLLTAVICLPSLPKNLRVSVERASIAGYNLTANNRLIAAFNFTVRSINPHRGVSYYYDEIDAAARYRDLDLNSTLRKIPPFHQPSRNATDLNLDLAAATAVNESVAGDLRTARGSGSLDLELKITAKMRLKLGVLKVIHRTLIARCGPFAVPFNSSGVFQRALCYSHIRE